MCTICGKTYAKINGHLRIAHGLNKKLIECSECGKGFLLRRDLISHINNIHRKEKPYSCIKCKKSYTGTKGLLHHVCGQLEASHVCEICSKRFTFKQYLEKHMTVHSDTAKYACFRCGRKYKYPTGLVRHKRMCTPKEFW